MSSPVNTAANEVTTLQTTRANLAAKEAAFLGATTTKATLLSNIEDAAETKSLADILLHPQIWVRHST